jgi:hypothetical protein
MFARATKGDMTPTRKKFCEILRQLSLTRTDANYRRVGARRRDGRCGRRPLKNEWLTLLRLLKKLGKHAVEPPK